MAVRDRFISDPPPNWTAVGLIGLAGFDFGIKVIARLPPIADNEACFADGKEE